MFAIRHMCTLIVATVFVCSFVAQALATTQELDLLILEGAQYQTYGLPAIAESMPGVDIPKFHMLHTANWNGYRAAWAVINSQLFLIGVEGKIHETKGERMHSTPELFPKISFPFKVTTFTGKIEIKGRDLDYEIKGNTITYTDKLLLEFKNGMIVKTSKTTHDEELNRPANGKPRRDVGKLCNLLNEKGQFPTKRNRGESAAFSAASALKQPNLIKVC